MGRRRGRFPKEVTRMFVAGGMFLIWSLFIGQCIGLVTAYLTYAGEYERKKFQNAIGDDIFTLLYILNGIFIFVGIIFLTESKKKILTALPVAGNVIALVLWIWMRHSGILVGFSQVSG